MSTGAIVAISVVGLLVAVLIPLRIDVARQRRMIQLLRARLAAAGAPRRRASGVNVLVVRKIGKSQARFWRTTTCTLTDDGLYCLGDDGAWGGRVRFAPGAPEIGDVVMTDEPSLVMSGRLVEPGERLPPATANLAALPAEGLELAFEGDLSWFVAVPEADAWHADLMAALRASR